MLRKIDEFIEKQNMLASDDVVVAGVSGGADSMCLLCVLNRWRKKLGFSLVVVHVNHGLRGATADAEEEEVKMVCAQAGIPFEAYHVNVRAMAEKEKLSEEEAGRICRRRAFEETMKTYKGTKIALAHHKNDNAETFLFHLARGSRLPGLGGMKPVNGCYIRPLLCVSRKEIEAILEREEVTYCIDESNQTDDYSRNRIRNHVIPYLEEQINKQTVEHVNQTMEYLRRVQEYLEAQVEILWKKSVTESASGSLKVSSEIQHEEGILREILLKQMLVKVAGEEKDLTEKHVKALEELLEKQVGRCMDFPYQISAVRTYDGIELRRQKQEEMPQDEVMDLTIAEDEETNVIFGKYKVSVRCLPRTENQVIPKKTFTKWFDYDIIKSSVCVRTRMPGDRITISRDGSSKKLKNYFIDEKIPSEERGQIPLIAEADQILWVVGYRQSMAYQVTEQTKRILEITISGGN